MRTLGPIHHLRHTFQRVTFSTKSLGPEIRVSAIPNLSPRMRPLRRNERPFDTGAGVVGVSPATLT